MIFTNAGALLADESPMRHSRLFCTRWNGLDKASGVMEALDDKEFSGSLLILLQGGEEFVKNNTKKRWKKTSDGRLEMPDIPERAALECIVNGLIHRDYLELYRILIRIMCIQTAQSDYCRCIQPYELYGTQRKWIQEDKR